MDGTAVALRERLSTVSERERDRARILIVEDDEMLAAAMATALRSHGYRVEAAGSVRAGLEALALEPPDLLLTDINLPDGEGWQVAQAASDRILGGPAIVVISSNRLSRSEQRTRGVSHYVSKPFDVVDLLAAVDDALDPA
jgi:DNA-binding response OmpR family regulator